MLEPEKLIHNLASRFKRVEAGANTGMIDKIIGVFFIVLDSTCIVRCIQKGFGK